jgi:hypothetical protein
MDEVVGAFIEGPTAEESAALQALAALAAPADMAELKAQSMAWALSKRERMWRSHAVHCDVPHQAAAAQGFAAVPRLRVSAMRTVCWSCTPHHGTVH